MDLTVIHREVHREPFRPFTLRMSDSRDFYIRHPELIMIGEDHIFVIDDETNRGIYLEPALIASMQPDEEQQG